MCLYPYLESRVLLFISYLKVVALMYSLAYTANLFDAILQNTTMEVECFLVYLSSHIKITFKEQRKKDSRVLDQINAGKAT